MRSQAKSAGELEKFKDALADPCLFGQEMQKIAEENPPEPKNERKPIIDWAVFGRSRGVRAVFGE